MIMRNKQFTEYLYYWENIQAFYEINTQLSLQKKKHFHVKKYKLSKIFCNMKVLDAVSL